LRAQDAVPPAELPPPQIFEDKWARAYARKYRAELVDAETGADLAWFEQVVVYAG